MCEKALWNLGERELKKRMQENEARAGCSGHAGRTGARSRPQTPPGEVLRTPLIDDR